MKRIGALLCGLLLCVALSGVMWQAYEAAQEGVTPLESTQQTTASTEESTTTEAPPATELPPEEPDLPTLVMEWVEFSPFSSQSGTLVLVDSGYVGAQTVWRDLGQGPSALRLQEEAYLALCAMLRDYRGDPVRVRYAAARAESDAPPVCRGGVYASGLDVCLEGVDKLGGGVPFFSLAIGKEWLYQNCTAYGFVPCGEGVFGEEAGHFRYVGAPHAQTMREHGESLAAYLARLRCDFLDYEGALCVQNAQRIYRIFYVWQDALGRSGALLPADADYRLSGDNRGGVIVTVIEPLP